MLANGCEFRLAQRSPLWVRSSHLNLEQAAPALSGPTVPAVTALDTRDALEHFG